MTDATDVMDLRDAQALLVAGCRDKARMVEFMVAERGPRRGQLIMNSGGAPHCYTALPTGNRIGPAHGEDLERWEALVVIFTYTQVIRAWENGRTAREIVDMAYRSIPDWATA